LSGEDGLRSVSKQIAPYVDLLGVASIDEALALRAAGVTTPILLMEGVFAASELPDASRENFHVVLHSKEQLQWINNFSGKLHVWLKLDTGMGRLGFNPAEAAAIYQHLVQHPSIEKPVRIISHFACADEPNHPLNQQQIKRFEAFIKPVKTEFSLCNSAGIFQFPENHYDFIRPGITLYGASPFADKTGLDLGLKPVMTLQSTLIAVNQKPAGTCLGYGARFTCPEEMLVGVVACGYGDGYPRSAKDGTPVLVNNIRTQLLGRISMDMMAVDLRACPTAKVGDPVILWGEGLPINEIAQFTDQSAYDLLTGMQHRVKLEWI
jgi:alanine racemase